MRKLNFKEEEVLSQSGRVGIWVPGSQPHTFHCTKFFLGTTQRHVGSPSSQNYAQVGFLGYKYIPSILSCPKDRCCHLWGGLWVVPGDVVSALPSREAWPSNASFQPIRAIVMTLWIGSAELSQKWAPGIGLSHAFILASSTGWLQEIRANHLHTLRGGSQRKRITLSQTAGGSVCQSMGCKGPLFR